MTLNVSEQTAARFLPEFRPQIIMLCLSERHANPVRSRDPITRELLINLKGDRYRPKVRPGPLIAELLRSDSNSSTLGAETSLV